MNSPNYSKLKSLETKIGYQFKNTQLLIQALTHRSYGAKNNERFEFVGDAILNYSIAKLLFNTFEHLPEGSLSRIRANLVNQETLSQIAMEINLGDYLLLGQGEIKMAGNTRPSILSDALEAIFAAISFDSDFSSTEKIIRYFYKQRIKNINPENAKDPKSLLQEQLQAQKLALPEYKIIEQTGVAHKQIFKIQCSINELNIKTMASAESRRKAEQMTAQIALDIINQQK